MSDTVPCPTCPWRTSSTVGGSDIPLFDIDKMRGLRNTVPGDDNACVVGDPNGDAIRPIMACHYSACGAETPCVGYLYRHGWSNIAVRLMSARGAVDLDAIDEQCSKLDLWPDFHTMLDAYEAAQ